MVVIDLLVAFTPPNFQTSRASVATPKHIVSDYCMGETPCRQLDVYLILSVQSPPTSTIASATADVLNRPMLIVRTLPI